LSADSIQSDDDDAATFPELLNNINITGLPPHELHLKIGSPVILLRNLNSKMGLCNGTRLTVDKDNEQKLVFTYLIQFSHMDNRM
jgi:hypothetical protein